MFKKISSSFFAVFFITFTIVATLMGCDSDIFGNNQPTDITLSSTLMEFDTIKEIQGKNLQLEATITLKGGSKSKEVSWEFPSDDKAFKVQSTAGGVLTFQIYKSGTYVISAHAMYEGKAYKTAQCVITINDALTHLRIMNVTDNNTILTDNSASMELMVGNTVTLAPVFTPESTSQQTVLWSIDNAAVASISEQPGNKATLTAKSKGTATVSLISQDNTSISRTLKLTVIESGAEQKFGLSKIEVSPTEGAIEIGTSQTFTATVWDANSNIITSDKVAFSLTEESKSAFQLGNVTDRSVSVTATHGGTGTLLATFTRDGETVESKVPLSVTGNVENISVKSSYINLLKGAEELVNVFYSPENTKEKGFTVSDYDPSIISVIENTADKDGSFYIRANNIGTTKVQIKSIYNNAIVAEIGIGVVDPKTKADRISRIEIGTPVLTVEPLLNENGEAYFDPIDLFASIYTISDNGSEDKNDNNYNVTFESSDSSVVYVFDSSYVNADEGYKATLKVLKPGKARIYAKSADNKTVTAYCDITVNGTLKALIAENSAITLTPGDKRTVTLTPNPYNAVMSMPSVSLSNDAVSASIKRENGVYKVDIEALKLGETTVSYYVDGKTVSTTRVTVGSKENNAVRTITFKDITSALYLKQDEDPKTFTVEALDSKGLAVDKKIELKPETETANEIVTIERVGDTNTFTISPKNAGKGNWIFYINDTSGIKSVLHVEVGGSAVQGEDIRAIKAPFNSFSLSLKDDGKKEETIKINTIPLGGEEVCGKLIWSISDNDVAELVTVPSDPTDFTRIVRAVGEGTATITAETKKGLKTTINVRVFGRDVATNTVISKAYIAKGSTKNWAMFSTVGESFELEAVAYNNDGSVASGELFNWTYQGEGVKSLLMEKEDGVIATATTKASFRISSMPQNGYDNPVIITATSVNNPAVRATFMVYIVASEPTEEKPIIIAEYSGVTLSLESEKTKKMDIKYNVYPLSYDTSNMEVTSSSTVVSAKLNKNTNTLSLTAQEAGNATVTVSDGKLSFDVSVNVVEKAIKEDPKITSIRLDRSYLSYDLADKALQTITATVYKDGEEASNEGVTWTSSDESIVKISTSGKIAQVLPQDKVGTAFITATSINNANVSASCSIEVIDSSKIAETLRYINISQTNVILDEGDRMTLTVSGQPENLVKTAQLTWKSSKPDVVMVSNGTITALKEGEADITVSTVSDGKTFNAVCHVKVNADITVPKSVSSIRLSDSIMRIAQDDMDKTFRISATLYDQSGEELSGRSVNWKVKDTDDVLEYNTDDLSISFIPKNPGKATIEATVGAIKAEAIVIVAEGKGADKTLQKILLSPNVTIARDEKYTVKASLVPATAEDSIVWNVSDTAMTLAPAERGKLLTVSSAKAGVYTLTAQSVEHPAVKATTTVTVKDSVKSDEVTEVRLDVKSVLLDLADKKLTELKATVYKGGKVSDGDVEWAVDDSLKNIITYKTTGKNAIAIAKTTKLGEGYITATSKEDGTKKASCFVKVVDTSSIVAKSIEYALLSSTTLSLEKGTTHLLKATAYPANVTTTTRWVSSDETIATVSDNGLVSAVSEGSATITALVKGGEKEVTLNCRVNVYEKSLVSTVAPQLIKFSSNVVYLNQEKMDETVSVTATVIGEDGSDYIVDENGKQAIVSWRIDNENTPDAVANIAYADNIVTLSPKNAGTAKVYATYQGIENSFTVVTGSKSIASSTDPESISFMPNNVVMKVGDSTTVTAYVQPTGAKAEYAFTVKEGSDVVSAQYSGNKVRLNAKKIGTATIEVMLLNKPEVKATITVKVLASTEGKLTSIQLDKNYIALELDTKALTTVKATAYVDGKASKDVELEWSLEGLTTDQISYTLLNTGDTVSLVKKKAGSGYLVCRAKDNPEVFSKCKIDIIEGVKEEDLKLNRIEISPKSITLRTAESVQLRADLVPSGVKADIVWTTDNADIARVDKNGVVTGVSKGQAVITAQSYDDNISATATVEVVENQRVLTPSAIRLSTQLVQLDQENPDEEKSVIATVYAKEDNAPIADAVVSWTIDDSSVANLTVNGNTATLKAGDAGKTNLRAYFGNSLSATAVIYSGITPTEKAELDRLSVSPSVITIETGKSETATVKAFPAGILFTPEWESEDTQVASVDKNTKNLTKASIKGEKQGKTTVTVKDTGTDKKTNLTVRVFDDISKAVTGVYLDKSGLSFDIAEKSMATVSAKVYVNKTFASSEKVKWTLLNEDLVTESDLVTFVATDSTGLTIGVKPNANASVKTGKAYLRATSVTDSEMYSQVFVEVVDSSTAPTKITEILCETDTTTLSVGSTRTFRAVTYPEGIKADVRWMVIDQKPTNGTDNVITTDIYGKVTAVSEGSATLKAYVYGSSPELSDTVAITVTATGKADEPSKYEIGSIKLVPSQLILSQTATFPTTLTARIYDKSGKELPTEQVNWNTDGIRDIANVVRTQGNVLYLEAKSAGKGEVIASKTSADGTKITASADVVTGGVVNPEETYITNLAFNRSMPIYLVANSGKSETATLKFTPESKGADGVVWSSRNYDGYIQFTTNNTSITATGLKETPENAPVVVTATSASKDINNTSLSADAIFKVVSSKEELPEVTSLTLDKTRLVLDLSEKAVATVTATAFDANGKVVPSAKIEWTLRNNTTTNVSITDKTGPTVGVNKGTKEGRVELVASCGEVSIVCDISVIDSSAFMGISVGSKEVRLVKGSSTVINVYGTPTDMFTGATCTISGDADAVRVSPDAIRQNFSVTALKAGTAFLHFTSEVDGKIYTADSTVYVNDPGTESVTSMSFTPKSVYLASVGDKIELTTVLYDKYGNVVKENVEYKAEDPSVVSLKKTQNGVEVTALKKGTTAVYAYCGSISSQSFIMIGDGVAEDDTLLKIIPSMTTLEMKKNQIQDVTLTAVPSSYQFKALAVASNRTDVAIASVKNGLVEITAVGEGTATITVSEGKISENIEVNVSGIATPAYIEFDKTGLTLKQETNSRETVNAYVYDKDKNLLALDIALWQTSDPFIAKIMAKDGKSVTVAPGNMGDAEITANVGKVSSSFSVSVNTPEQVADAPTNIKANQSNVKLGVGDTAELSVFFEPTTLKDSKKTLLWKTNNDKIASVSKLSNGKAMVTGVAVGKTSVIATSTVGEKVATVFNVNVVPESDKDIYRIELDKNQITLDLNKDSFIKARLYKNDVEVDASEIQWSIEGQQTGVKLKFYDGVSYVDRIIGESAGIKSESNAGVVYVVASYANTSSRAQVTVTDNKKAFTGLTSVAITTKNMVMEVGETVTFTATALPQVAGISYTWSSSDSDLVEFLSANANSVTLRALKEGTTEIIVEAALAGYDSKKDSRSTLRIEKQGALDTTYKYSSVKLDKTSLSMLPNGSYATVTATLVDKNNKEVEAALSGWDILDYRGNVLVSWTPNGYTFGTDTNSYSTLEAVIKAAKDNAISIPFTQFEVIGANNSIVHVTPTVSGIFFIEAKGPVENNKYVSSKMMLEVSGGITGVGFNSSYLHLIKGEKVQTTVSTSPTNAQLTAYQWQEKVATAGGKQLIDIQDATVSSAYLFGREIGTTAVEYTATDTTGVSMNAQMTVQVHDPSYGTGGIRNISFDNVYATASYPYQTATYKATAYYMDGTTAEDSDITYKVFNSDGSSATDGNITRGEGYDTKIATFTITENGVRITPFAKGTVKVVATLNKDGAEFTAEMYLNIVGNSSQLTPSSSSIILYTGGSAKIDLTTDNGHNNEYEVELISEYTKDGHKIVGGYLEGTETVMQSVFTFLKSTVKTNSVTIGTKALLTEGQRKDGTNYSGSKYLLTTDGGEGTLTEAQYNEIVATFPRTAAFKVTTADGQSSTIINVTVNQLPTGNSYPLELTLDISKVDLTPPFTTENTVKASLKDIANRETTGTINWYYYPVGSEIEENEHKLDTKKAVDKDTISAYFSADGKTMYYTPKLSGLYRLKAECVQNPQLTSTATINVGGSVTGVTSSVGSSLRIEKGASATVSAVFTPESALARTAYFALDETIKAPNGDPLSRVIENTKLDNNYLSITVNNGAETGDTATIYGKLSTGNENRQMLRIIYPQTTAGESTLNSLKGEGCFYTLTGTTMKAWTLDTEGNVIDKLDANGKPISIEVFFYSVTVDVYANKTVYAFKASGATEVNPNDVKGSVLTYNVTASTNTSNTDNTFSNWDWVEAKLVGADTNMVYASSVPVDADGHSLYQATANGEVKVKTENGDKAVAVESGKYYPESSYFTTETKGLEAKD